MPKLLNKVPQKEAIEAKMSELRVGCKVSSSWSSRAVRTWCALALNFAYLRLVFALEMKRRIIIFKVFSPSGTGTNT